jgi:hypothetical protein
VGEYRPLKQFAAAMDEDPSCFEPFIIILSVVEYIRLPYISPNMVRLLSFKFSCENNNGLDSIKELLLL